MSFYDRKEVRDVLAYLKLVANPTDEPSLLRIINIPARGISQATVKRLLDEAIRRENRYGMCWHAKQLDGLPANAIALVDHFRIMIERFHRQIREKSPVELAKAIIRDVAYKDELTRLYPNVDDQTARWAAVEEWSTPLNYSRRASEPSMAGFPTGSCDHRDEPTKIKESELDAMP